MDIGTRSAIQIFRIFRVLSNLVKADTFCWEKTVRYLEIPLDLGPLSAQIGFLLNKAVRFI